jgi:hypothetical protein
MTRALWEVEQARLTEQAQLLLAPSSMVFEELKTRRPTGTWRAMATLAPRNLGNNAARAQ